MAAAIEKIIKSGKIIILEDISILGIRKIRLKLSMYNFFTVQCPHPSYKLVSAGDPNALAEYDSTIKLLIAVFS